MAILKITWLKIISIITLPPCWYLSCNNFDFWHYTILYESTAYSTLWAVWIPMFLPVLSGLFICKSMIGWEKNKWISLENVWDWGSLDTSKWTRKSTDILQMKLSIWDCWGESSVKSYYWCTIDYSHRKIHRVENSPRCVDFLRFIGLGYSHEFLFISSFLVWMVHQTEFTVLSLDFGSSSTLEAKALSMKTLARSVKTLGHEQWLFKLCSKLFKLLSKLFKSGYV